MASSESAALPCVAMFNINGSGMGHLSTCLAYANRLRGRARVVFFSLAAAVELINEMGFEADYFVSRFWSRATSWAWDQQLSLRLGLFLERVRPDVIVFDGTWPYRGLLHAAATYGASSLVWSNLVLYKKGTRKVPVEENNFDLLVRLGEIGSSYSLDRDVRPGRAITIPPVTLLGDDQIPCRNEARDMLGLDRDGRYALFSLGPGNLKDVGNIGRALIHEVTNRGYTPVWSHAPISVRDVSLPEGVIAIRFYPLLKVMRAFDLFIGAAGYNTCCEVLQTGIPTLFVPNERVSDDQTRRGELVARAVPAVVSPCETPSQAAQAVERLVTLQSTRRVNEIFDLSGADIAAEEILALVSAGRKRHSSR